MEETMIVPLLPMSKKETEEVFKGIDPTSIQRFIQTKREEIKEKIVSCRKVEDMRYEQGRIAGLEEFLMMAKGVCIKDNKDNKSRVALISKVNRDKILAEGQAIRPK